MIREKDENPLKRATIQKGNVAAYSSEALIQQRHQHGDQDNPAIVGSTLFP